jgi:hypothetical protein
MSWMPTWDLVATKNLEIRKRRGLIFVVILLIVGPPVLLLGFRLLFYAVDPRSYDPAGRPAVFGGLSNTIAEFGFLAAATIGAAAGTTDLTEGVFRSLVITGRSRLALYLARIPAGLAIIVPLVALAFTSTGGSNPAVNEMAKIGLWNRTRGRNRIPDRPWPRLAHRAANGLDHRGDRARDPRDPDPGRARDPLLP